MNRLIKLLALASVASLPIHATAQSVSVKWATTSKPVWLNADMPTGCDRPLQRAVTTWNNAASRFQYQFDPAYNITSTRWTESNDPNVTIEDGTTSTSTALMSTSRRTVGSQITDADVIVKADYLWYYNDESGGRFYCPPTASSTPSGSYDYESSMVHELGHALGFDHGGATTCIMYPTLGTGVSRRSPCSAETTAIRNAYGAR